MMRILYTLALVTILAFKSKAQPVNVGNDDISILQDFIDDIANLENRADLILSKHVLIENTSTDEAYDYLEASIEEIRLNIQTKDLNAIEYVPFQELPRRETNDIDPEGK